MNFVCAFVCKSNSSRPLNKDDSNVTKAIEYTGSKLLRTSIPRAVVLWLPHCDMKIKELYRMHRIGDRAIIGDQVIGFISGPLALRLEKRFSSNYCHSYNTWKTRSVDLFSPWFSEIFRHNNWCTNSCLITSYALAARAVRSAWTRSLNERWTRAHRLVSTRFLDWQT